MRGFLRSCMETHPPEDPRRIEQLMQRLIDKARTQDSHFITSPLP